MVASITSKEGLEMLPEKIYELIRWLIAIVIPATGILVTSLTSIWNWDFPAQQISLSLDAIGLFLGAIFGISKIVNDRSNNGSTSN